MSAQALSWAWGQQTATPLAKLVLITLANRADEYGVCYRGQNHLAEMCCCTVKAVQDNLVRLEEAKLIKRRERRRVNGSRTTDLYLLGPRGPRGDMLRPDPKHENWASIADVLEEAEAAANGQGEDASPRPGQQGEDASPLNANESGGHPDKPLDKPSATTGGARVEMTDAQSAVVGKLDALAKAKGCQRAKAESVVRAVEAFPAVNHLAVAEELEFWALHGNGTRRQIKSLAGTYRNFLKRAADDAAVHTSDSRVTSSAAAKYDDDAIVQYD